MTSPTRPVSQAAGAFASASRTRALALASAHGWNATSLQTLGEGFSYFFHGDGYVAYVDTGSAWVAAGAPVCSEDALSVTAHAFVAAAGAAGRRSCFFGVEPRLLESVGSTLDHLQIGEQPVYDPRTWLDSLRSHPGLREQLRRARAKGVVVRHVMDHERAAVSDRIHRLLARWLATRAMPPMGFLVAVTSTFESVGGARFAAWHDGRLVAVANVIPVPGRRGWYIEHLLRDPNAPNGTVELLVDAVMAWAASAGCSWLTLGLAPLSGDVAGPLRVARRRLGWLYNFEGLHRFKAKLRPRDWVPIHLAYPHSQGAVISTVDALEAFAPGGILQFGARFVVRGYPAVLGVLGALLVPWMALLALASDDHWFAGHTAVKWAWIGFDAAVCAGIALLLRRPSWQLSALLASVVTLDAVVTPVEAALWNVGRVSTLLDVVVLLLACAAPLLAAVALWGNTARLKQAA